VTSVEFLFSLERLGMKFGLENIQRLCAALGHPERSFRSVIIAGTNGKGSVTAMTAAALHASGCRTARYTSPHLERIEERFVLGEREVASADLEDAAGAVRTAIERLVAEGVLEGLPTFFECATAIAFELFRRAAVDIAVVEVGLGGRLDATNVVDAPVVLLTNVTLEHADVLGETPEEIAREKLAVAHAARVVVLPDNTFATLVPHGEIRLGGAREAAAAYLGRPIDAEVQARLPGRFERRNGLVLDGAHTPEAADWLLSRLPREEHVLCVSILRDKDADAILERLARAGHTLVATRSSNDRALDEKELGRRAEPYFQHVETVADPREALERAQALGPRVLVTGSLYLLADLNSSD
jgi:dihydrofolate synthase / folylpolyglutamate synthase